MADLEQAVPGENPVDREAGSPEWPALLDALPLVIGHRGAAATAPENTLAGIRQAKALGARWVEFDVQLTSDRQPILMHDSRLDRTTNGCGRVAATGLDAIRELDAGGWFDRAFEGEPVPTFEEALAVCAALDLGINVEIKPCRGREAETARVVVETLLGNWPATAPAPLISSFVPECLAVALAVAPDLRRGHLDGSLPRRWRDRLRNHGCATLHLDQRHLRDRHLAEILAAGAPLVVYTVNDPTRARALIAAGASSIITDRVGEMLAALA